MLDTEKVRVVHQRKGWRVGRERGNEEQFKVDIEFDNPQEIELRLLALRHGASQRNCMDTTIEVVRMALLS